MSLKIKVIIAAVIIIATVASVVSIFVYINHLNNKIADLNVTLTEQKNEIQALNCQIESLEKNVESFRETINVTNDYIENMEKTRLEEMNLKQEIYETIVEDPVAQDWYNESIPQSLIDLLINESNDLACTD
jgi:chromosome segregation ATPase